MQCDIRGFVSWGSLQGLAAGERADKIGKQGVDQDFRCVGAYREQEGMGQHSEKVKLRFSALFFSHLKAEKGDAAQLRRLLSTSDL